MAVKIMEGIEQGAGPKEIAGTITQYFEDQSEWRALRIARTEVISGYAQGSLEGYRQTGIVKQKQWLTAGDDRVEGECLLNEADGPIALEATFTSGVDAPPVHCNCRCTLQPVV